MSLVAAFAGAVMDANRPELPHESTSSTTFHVR